MGKKSLADTSKTIERYSEHLQRNAQKRQASNVSSHEPKMLQYLSPFIFLSVILLLALIMLKPGFTGLVTGDTSTFPKFSHEQVIPIPANQEFVIDLDTWFISDDTLVYTITNTKHIKFSVLNNMLTVQPDNDFIGSEVSNVYANHKGKTTRVAINFIVSDNYYFLNKEMQSTLEEDKTIKNKDLNKKEEKDEKNKQNSITGAFIAITGAPIYTSCGIPITATGTHYLSTDITSSGAVCIDIQVSDVTIDCQGSIIVSSIVGSTSAIQITANPANNIYIKNCGFNNYNLGIQMTGVDGTNITIENSTFTNLVNSATGIVIDGTNINNVQILRNRMSNVQKGINIKANNTVIQDNRFSARATPPFDTGIVIQGGKNILVKENNIIGFNKGVIVDNSFATKVVFTKNNFSNSQTIHAEVWNPAGTVYFNASQVGAAPGLEAEGNFWEGSPYTDLNDSDADGFADPLATGTVLPLDNNIRFIGPFAGQPGVGAGVEDFGPIVGIAIVPPPPPPPPTGNCLNITVSSTVLLTLPTPECIDIQIDDVTIDCQGLTLQGAGSGNGIIVSVSPAEKIRILNCHIDNFNNGLNFNEINELKVQYSSFTNNNEGIHYNTLTESVTKESMINNSLFDKNQIGIRGLTQTRNVSLGENNFTNNTNYGIYITNASLVTLTNNTFIDNGNATFFDPSSNSLIQKNKFIRNRNTAVYLEDSSNFIVENNYLERNNVGILLIGNSLRNTIRKNEFAENNIQARNLVTGIPTSDESIWVNNYWSDIFTQDLDFQISGSGDFADGGTKYPYSEANGGNVDGNVVDRAPNINPCSNWVSHKISYNVHLPDDVVCNDGITFTANNLFFDCDANTVTGPLSITMGAYVNQKTAFDINGKNDITIRECDLPYWGIGVSAIDQPVQNLLVTYNTMDPVVNGIFLSDTINPSRITGTRILGNTIINIEVGIHALSETTQIIGNILSSSNTATNPVGIEIYGGNNYSIMLNTLTGFDYALINSISAATGILTRNNFLSGASTILHVQYSLPGGISPALQFYFDPITGTAGYREQGNYWSSSPYLPTDDTNRDLFADIGGANPLPLNDLTFFSAPFSGSAVSPGVADQGPMVAQQVPTECTDGIDNDMDGFIDYPADPECLANPYGAEDGKVIATCGMTIMADSILINDLIINGDCITIGANDVTLDCKRHKIIGNGSGRGISWVGLSGVEILNCEITNFGTGIESMNADITTLGNNTVYNHSIACINLYESALVGGNHYVYDNNAYNCPFNRIQGTTGSNRILGNTFGGSISETALEFTGSDSWIMGNTIGENLVAGPFIGGLFLKTSARNNTIVYNNIYNNTPFHAAQEDSTDVNQWSILALNIFGQLVQQGNRWGIAADTDSPEGLIITDANSDGFGDTGVPYDEAKGGRVSDGVSDQGPILRSGVTINIPPIAICPTTSIAFPKNTVDTSIDLDTIFSDPDNQPQTPLTFVIPPTQDFNFSINPTTHVLSITPDNNFVGCNNAVFSAHDGLVMVQCPSVQICTTGSTFGGASGEPSGSGSGGSSTQQQCKDGLDNDRDGLIDYPKDPDCTSRYDSLEQGNVTACTEAWVCQPFSACNDGQQTRTCRDVQQCGTITKRPALTQTCTVAPTVQPPIVIPPTPVVQLPPPPTPQQPVQIPWVCSTFLPVGILVALIIAFVMCSIILFIRWHSKERGSKTFDLIMWLFVVIPFAMLITELIICKTTSLLNWIIMLAIVIYAIYVTYYSTKLKKNEFSEDFGELPPLAPLEESSESSIPLPPQQTFETLIPTPVEKTMEPAYVTKEPSPFLRKQNVPQKIPQRREEIRNPEVYLVPETQERPLPEHRKELRQIRKDLDMLKKEGNTARQKEKIDMAKIDHFLREMENTKKETEIIPVTPKPTKKFEPVGKKYVKSVLKKKTKNKK